MRWKRNTGFDQIEDRRGQGGGASFGFPTGGSGSAIPIPLPGKAGGGLGGLSGGGAVEPGGTLDPQSDTDQQLAYIVDNIQTYWATTFSQSGRDYPETKLVLFDGSTQSDCGPASAATGPF